MTKRLIGVLLIAVLCVCFISSIAFAGATMPKQTTAPQDEEQVAPPPPPPPPPPAPKAEEKEKSGCCGWPF
jgi:hypothetical protein